MYMKENINININSSHPIVKKYYYKIFMSIVPEKKVDLHNVNYLIGPGGVGKTHSTSVATSFLESINIKTLSVSLKNRVSIRKFFEEAEKAEVLIFDGLNEALDILAIKGEIESLVDGKKLVIINTRYINEIEEINKNLFYEINYKESFQSFINENRMLKDEIKNELWKTILKFYGPDFLGNENDFKVNLRTLRLLYISLNKKHSVDRNDDAVIQIRKAYENVIKNDLLGDKKSWDIFKNNVYDYENNLVDLTSIPNKDLKILENYDLLRINEGAIEIRDFNMIDHIISLSIINNSKGRGKISFEIADFQKDLLFLSDYVDSVQGYFSSKLTLKMMVIYQYLFRISSKKEIIEEDEINRLIQNHALRNLIIMSIGLMKFSGKGFDYLKGYKIHLPVVNLSEYFELSELFYVVFGKLVKTKYYEDLFSYEDFDLEILSKKTSENVNNIIFNSNVVDLIAYIISIGEDSQIFSDYLGNWFSSMIKNDKIMNINEIIKNTIEIKGSEHGSHNYVWRNSKRISYRYAFLIILIVLQRHLAIYENKTLLIDGDVFEKYLNDTYTFANLNKISTIDKSILSDFERAESEESFGTLSPKWSKAVLDDICHLTNSSVSYEVNNAFIQFTNDYSMGYNDKIFNFYFRTKNKYILEDKWIKKSRDLDETLALDKYLYANQYKTLKINEIDDVGMEDELFCIGNYNLYLDSWSKNNSDLNNIYDKTESMLNSDIQKVFNVLISNIENKDTILKAIEEFSKLVIENKISLLSYIETNRNVKTYNNNEMNHNLIVMANDETFNNFIDEYESNWINPTINNIINGKLNEFKFDGNRTIFAIQEYYGRRYFKLERRYSKIKPVIGAMDNIEWTQIIFTINEDGTFIAEIHIPNDAIRYDSQTGKKEKINYDSSNLDFIK